MPAPPQLISVRCNHCGAPLEVSAGARFVTCAHCGSQLAVHQSDSAFYTEVLGDIANRTERIERDVQQIKQQNQIEALDREWEQRRQSLLVRGKNGDTSTPTVGAGILALVISLVFGVFWVGMAISMGAPAFFPLFGLFFIGAGIFVGIKVIAKAGEYQNAEAEYRRQRAKLLEQPNEPAQMN